jgi:bifunctional DNA-binding transcriptional regulator/antitoxin component of YhaV-PrlF toxin-antitoxin module
MSPVETKVVQVRGRGTLTLPARIRERYGLTDGDPITIVDLDGVLVLSPKVGLVPKLAAEIERLRTSAGLSLDDLLDAQAEVRQSGSS